MESPMQGNLHVGFGEKGMCFLLGAIQAWQRALTPVEIEKQDSES
jgi:hypothetical protein